MALPADAIRRLGALNVLVVEDAERLLAAAAALQRRASRASPRWRRRGGACRSAMDEARRARADLPHRAEAFVERALLAWARAHGRRRRCGVARARDAAAALERAGVSAQGGGFHRAGCREGAGARRRDDRRARRPGSRQDFRRSRRARESDRRCGSQMTYSAACSDGTVPRAPSRMPAASSA